MTSIVLHKPEAGHNAELAVRPGQTYTFDFDASAVNFDSTSSDLVLHFDDGAVLLLKGFLSVSATSDFTIAFSDGVEVSAKDAASMFTMALEDFHTNGAEEADEHLSGGVQGAAHPLHVDGRPLPHAQDDRIPSGQAAAEQNSAAQTASDHDNFAPLCGAVCFLPDPEHDLFGSPGALITPHGNAGEDAGGTAASGHSGGSMDDHLDDHAPQTRASTEPLSFLSGHTLGETLSVGSLLDENISLFCDTSPAVAIPPGSDISGSDIYEQEVPDYCVFKQGMTGQGVGPSGWAGDWTADSMVQTDAAPHDPFLLALLSLGSVLL